MIFRITDSNREAVAWVERWPDWPSRGLIICGPAGSGKTHVLNLWQRKSGGAVIAAGELAARDVGDVTRGGAVAIDDADGVAGDAAAEEALFHLYNRLGAAKGFLVLAMNQPVAMAGIVLPDLRSRLLTLPVALLQPPDDVLMAALIIKQFRDRQITVGVGSSIIWCRA